MIRFPGDFSIIETSRLGSQADTLADAHSEFSRALGAQVGMSRAKALGLAELFRAATARYENAPRFCPGVILGDAHPGNFAFEPVTGEVGIFDVQNYVYSKIGNADPIADVGRFMAGVTVIGLAAFGSHCFLSG